MIACRCLPGTSGGQLLQNDADNGLMIAPSRSLPASATSSVPLQILAVAAEPACQLLLVASHDPFWPANI